MTEDVVVTGKENKRVANKGKKSWIKRLVHKLLPKTISHSSATTKMSSIEHEETTGLEIPLDTCIPSRHDKCCSNKNCTKTTGQHVDKMNHDVAKKGIERANSAATTAQRAGQLGNKTECWQQVQHGNKIRCHKKTQNRDIMGSSDLIRPLIKSNRSKTLTLEVEDIIHQCPKDISLLKGFWNSEISTTCLEYSDNYNGPSSPMASVTLQKLSRSVPVYVRFDNSSDSGPSTPPIWKSQSDHFICLQKLDHMMFQKKLELNYVDKQQKPQNTHCPSCFGVQGGPPVYTEPKRTCLRRRLLAGREHVNIISNIAKEIVKLRRVGHGHSSVVYQAVNVKSLEQVAIKEIWYDNMQSRGKNELSIIGLEMELDALRRQCMPQGEFTSCTDPKSGTDDEGMPCCQSFSPCPYIVNFYGMILEGSLNKPLAGLVLEYAEFGTLADWACNKSPITEPFVAHVARCVLNALISLQEWGFVHKDIKPENILLFVGAKGNIIAKVADFGISTAVSDSSDGSAPSNLRAAGTRRYMSPEALRLEGVDHRSDVYSLGVTLATFTNDGLCPVPHAISEFEQINHTFNSEYEILRWGCTCCDDKFSSFNSSYSDYSCLSTVSNESQTMGSNYVKSRLSNTSSDGRDSLTISSYCSKSSSQSAVSTWLWDKTIPRPSMEARNFFSLCVKSDVALRPRANELLCHPFIQKAKMMHWEEVPHPTTNRTEVLKHELKHVIDAVVEGRKKLEGCCSSTNPLIRDWAQLPGFSDLARSLGVEERVLEVSFLKASDNRVNIKV